MTNNEFIKICPNKPCETCPYQNSCQDYLDWLDEYNGEQQ